jgi:hypothetical protein
MMKNLRYNWNMPNDVGVISKGNKQTRWKKVSQTMKGVKMN